MKIRDWDKFQHYKDRIPPWIKLHTDLLNSPDWHYLSPAAAKTLIEIWLLSSEYGGCLPEMVEVSFRLRQPADSLNSAIKELIDAGFIVDDGKDATDKPTSAEIASENGYGLRQISQSDREHVLARDGRCVNCSSIENLEVDHVIPVSKGGNSDISNLQILCRRCNREKGSKFSPEERLSLAD